MKNRRGLGKGLDALLAADPDLTDSPAETPANITTDSPPPPPPHSPSADSGGKGGRAAGTRMLRLSDLRPGPQQPRRDFNEAGLEELAESIRRHGVLQPILARPLKKGKGGDGEGDGWEWEWEIVAGERRWRAAQLAGLREIPAAVREMSDREAMFAALVENLQRADLNPLERARGISRLVEDLGMTQAEAGAEVGLSRSAVANILRLLELSPGVRRMVESGGLDAAHARALLGLGAAAQLEAARRIVSRGLSAREAERLARRMGAMEREKPEAADGGKLESADGDVRMLERELSSKLKSRAEIRHRKDGGGRLTIHYGSLEALDRILAKLRK